MLDPDARDQLMRALGVTGGSRSRLSLFEYESRHLPGLHDQKTHGNRYGRAAKKAAKAVGEVYDSLANGERVEVPPPPLDQLLEHLAGQEGVNLANLEVGGEGNSHLFTHHVRDIPRSEMPQIAPTVEGLSPFLESLAQDGVEFRLQKVDPRGLVMTQSELDSKKVAKMAFSMRDNGWKQGIVMMTARDGEILDGHHRWAGAAAAAAMGTEIGMWRLHVDMDIDTLLAYAERFSGAKAGIGTAA